jgi:hypothetical protein
MKTVLQGRRRDVWLVASVALVLVGCQTGGQKKAGGDMSSSANTSPMSIERNRVEARVRYLGQPNPFSFHVGDQNIGTDARVLISWLYERGVTDVIFDSEYKLTSKGVHDLVKQVNKSGIVIREFWIPRSTPPGRIDVLSSN